MPADCPDLVAAILRKHLPTGSEHAEHQLTVTEAYVRDFAARKPWQLSCVLTFSEREVTAWAAIGELHKWVAFCGKTLDLFFDYIFMVEKQEDETAHLHGLLVADRPLHRSDRRLLT